MSKETTLIFQHIDYLPKIPNDLILDIDSIRSKNDQPTVSFGKVFEVYDVDKKLFNYLNPYINFDASIRWQIVNDNLPLHCDTGDSSEKYIYLLKKGGDKVITSFWSKKTTDPVEGGVLEQEGRTKLLEVSENLHVWHKINVKMPHKVTGLDSTRLAIIIRPKD